MFGYIVVLVIVAGLAAAFSERGRSVLVPRGVPHRLVTAASACLLAILGVLLPRQFVYNSGDNAYLIIAMMGMWLVGNALPFAVATVLPEGAVRRITVQVGVALILVLGLLSVVLLAGLVAAFPGDDVRPEVARAHLFTALFALVAAATVLIGCRQIPAQRT